MQAVPFISFGTQKLPPSLTVAHTVCIRGRVLALARLSNWRRWLCLWSHCISTDKNGTACTGMHRTPVHPCAGKCHTVYAVVHPCEQVLTLSVCPDYHLADVTYQSCCFVSIWPAAESPGRGCHLLFWGHFLGGVTSQVTPKQISDRLAILLQASFLLKSSSSRENEKEAVMIGI